MNKILQIKFIRFLIVGTTTFLIDFTINNIIILILQTDQTAESVIANIISVPIAFLYNFIFSFKWTFRNFTQKRKKFFKYLAVGIFNYMISTLIIGTTVEFLTNTITIEPYLLQASAKFFVMIIIAFWSYFIYKNWVFDEE